MLLFLSYILGSLAEEDIGRHSATTQSVSGNATASKGLEVAVTNLQEYCNGTFLFSFEVYVVIILFPLLKSDVYLW